jgi:hypothetical protein
LTAPSDPIPFPWYRLRRAGELDRQGLRAAAEKLRDDHERARYEEHLHVNPEPRSYIGFIWFVTHVLNRPRVHCPHEGYGCCVFCGQAR